MYSIYGLKRNILEKKLKIFKLILNCQRQFRFSRRIRKCANLPMAMLQMPMALNKNQSLGNAILSFKMLEMLKKCLESCANGARNLRHWHCCRKFANQSCVIVNGKIGAPMANLSVASGNYCENIILLVAPLAQGQIAIGTELVPVAQLR